MENIDTENLNKHPRTPPMHNGAHVSTRSNENIEMSDGVRRDSWRNIFDHLTDDLSLLWEKQSRLMQVELQEKVGNVKGAAGSLGASAAFMLVGVFCLAITAIYALSLIVPAWAAAGIVTITFFVIGGVLAGIGKKKLEADSLKPKKSIETFEEMTTTLKERYNEFRYH